MAAKDETIQDVIHTKIWREEPEADNPFVASKCFCAGYDVYGDILNKATWFEYLYLMFKLERPENWQVELLEKVAIAIANPGIRDQSVRAAMNAGVGGSTSASALMAALAVGAGHLGGARETLICVNNWEICKQDMQQWGLSLSNVGKKNVDSWPQLEHPPGFDPNGVNCAKPVKQLLELCSKVSEAKNTKWLTENRSKLEKIAKLPLAITGVVAAVFKDIGFNAEESEMLFLLLRLPGAAVHTLEQKCLGYKKYPFFLGKLKIRK